MTQYDHSHSEKSEKIVKNAYLGGPESASIEIPLSDSNLPGKSQKIKNFRIALKFFFALGTVHLLRKGNFDHFLTTHLPL